MVTVDSLNTQPSLLQYSLCPKSTQKDQRNRVSCYVRGNAYDKELNIANVTIVNTDPVSNKVHIVEHAAFLVVANSDACNENFINYTLHFNTSSEVHNGSCSSFATDSNPCTCTPSVLSSKQCIYVVNCSKLARKISFSNYQMSKLGMMLSLTVTSNNGETGTLSYMRYYHSMFKCGFTSYTDDICNEVRKTFKKKRIPIRCNESNESGAYDTCQCHDYRIISGFNTTERTRRQAKRDVSESAATLFWNAVIRITGVKKKAEKTNFALFRTNTWLGISRGIIDIESVDRTILAEELSDIMLDGINKCPESPDVFYLSLLSLMKYRFQLFGFVPTHHGIEGCCYDGI